MVDEAHKRGLKVTGHLCSVTYAEAAGLGIDNLEHGFFAATDFVSDKQPDVCRARDADNRRSPRDESSPGSGRWSARSWTARSPRLPRSPSSRR